MYTENILVSFDNECGIHTDDLKKRLKNRRGWIRLEVTNNDLAIIRIDESLTKQYSGEEYKKVIAELALIKNEVLGILLNNEQQDSALRQAITEVITERETIKNMSKDTEK